MSDDKTAAAVSADETDDTETSTAVPEPAPKTTVTVTIDGRPWEAKPGQKVIDACEDAGSYVPRFCYHNRMSPVGMCRQCLVEIEGPRGPMMVVSCMQDVAPDQVVRTATDGVKRAQEGVIEMLLANHPLDCPVCDKGGECPLQDQAMSNGPGESRYVEEKRHFEKPIALSDLVLLDRERCILCDRCTRFADEVAGDKLIHFTYRGDNTQVLTFPDEPFASYFSGNTVQICPVGALTAVPYRFKARPWDLDEVESTCTSCAVGCRTVVQSSHDQLVRYQGVDSDAVNWSWLCDKGRFGFQAVHADERVAEPMVRSAGGLAATDWSTALNAAAGLLGDALAAGGPESIAVLGGARGTNEDAFLWAQLADAIGTPHRDAQYGDGLPSELLGMPRATINQAANAATIVLLAPDLKEELPVLYLRLRDAAEKRRSRIIELSPTETGLSPYAWKSVRVEPGTTKAITDTLGADDVRQQLTGGDVVVVAGRANLAESEALAAASLNAVLAACPGATVLPALRRGNVIGALSLGLRPGGLAAAGAPAPSPAAFMNGLGSRRSEAERGLGTAGAPAPSPAAFMNGLAILQAAAAGKLECLVLLGADPLNDCPDADLARQALAGARRIIAVDTHHSASTQHADVVLAAAAYGEKAGTTTNIEGRVQTVGQKITAAGTSRPDWMIALDLADRLGHGQWLLDIDGVDDVTELIAKTVPEFADVNVAALRSAADGVLITATGDVSTLPAADAVPDQRVSYDYRLVVGRKLYDRGVGTAMAPSLAALAPGSVAHVNPLDLEQLGVQAATEIKVIATRKSVVLPVVGNPAVPRGAVWVPFNQPGTPIADVIDATAGVTDVRLERL